MTTELEQEFFKTFGIEPKIKDGCKYADNYWNNERLANLYGTFDAYLKEKCPYENIECYTICPYSYDKEIYPEITNRILLELICIAYKAQGIELTIKDVKNEVLNNCIKYKDDIKQQIQSLFKEEE